MAESTCVGCVSLKLCFRCKTNPVKDQEQRRGKAICEDCRGVCLDCGGVNNTLSHAFPNSRCTPCMTERTAEARRRHYEANREDIAEKYHQYYEANREELLETRRRYWGENREALVEKQRRYREENREAVAEYRRRYGEENREKIDADNRRYREENRDKIAESHRRYYTENPEKFAEKGRLYRETNPEKLWATRQNSRARRWGALIVEDVFPTILWERDGGICHLCELPAGLDWQPDHLTPFSRGGEHSYANIAVSHPTCNKRKNAKLMSELDLENDFRAGHKELDYTLAGGK